MTLPRSAHAVVLTLSCYAVAQAAEPVVSVVQPAAPEPITKVEVKANADDYDPRRDDTASKTVITNAEIVKYGDTNVFDVLKRAPGVTVTGKTIRMRGLGGNYTQVLVDGERPPPGFSMDALVPDQIERIEVIRAASAEYSMQAIGGTINIVLKKAVSKAQRDMRLSLNRAREKKSTFVNGILADRRGNLSYFLNVTVVRNLGEGVNFLADQFTEPGGTIVQRRHTNVSWYSNSTSVNVTPRLNWKFSDADQLNLSGYAQYTRGGSGGISATTNDFGVFPQPDYVIGNLEDRTSARFAGVEANWVSKIAGGKLDAKVQTAGGPVRNDKDLLSITADSNRRLLRLWDTDTQNRSASTSGKYSRSLLDSHSLAAGWEISRQKSDNTIRRVEGLVGTDADQWMEDFVPTVRRVAVFAQDEWNISKFWSMYLGARWEGIYTESAGSKVATSESRNHVLSPVVQTLYKFPDKSGRQLRLAFARTFKAPTIGQLSSRRENADTNTRFNPDSSGNPSLRPELSSGIDLTYEHFWAPGAVFSTSTSIRRIRDYIRSTLTQDADGLWLIRPINDGDATVRSLDLEVKFPLKAVMKGNDIPAVDLRASLSRNWSQVSTVPEPDNRLDAQIPFSAVLGADYKFGNFITGINYAFRSGGMVRVSQEQSQRLQLRRDLDGYFQYTVRKGLDLRLSVGNGLGVDTLNYSRYQDASGFSESWARLPSSLELRFNIGIKY